MNKVNIILKLCAYEFRIQTNSKRVWMGYLTGIVIILQQSMKYLLYGDSTGSAVNVLEAFIVVGNNYHTVMFLVLGWLLILSEAPFINENSRYLIYRTDKRSWNRAMLLYICLQAVCYYGVLALATILFGVKNGFFANIWSSPLMALVSNGSRGSQFGISFQYPSFVTEVSVFQGFVHTWFLCFLYGVILGYLLYICSLFWNRLAGVVISFLFHFLGYEIMKEGFMMVVEYSFMARSIAALQIGNNLNMTISHTYFLYFIVLLFLTVISNRVIKHVDLKETVKLEGE